MTQKQCYQYSKGIYVHERTGSAVLTNEVELGLVPPARIGKYMRWIQSGDPVYHRAGELLIPFCTGKGVVKKLVRWLLSENELVSRSAALGLLHQPRTEKIRHIIGKLLVVTPDSIVQYRLIQLLARHGTQDEIPVLKEFSKRPTPSTPPDIC